MTTSRHWRVPPEVAQRRLDFAVRRAFDLSWQQSRDYIARGKVSINGEGCRDAARLVAAGDTLTFDLDARNLPREEPDDLRQRVLFIDAHLVVLNKPPGLSTVPYDAADTDTVMARLQRSLAKGRPQDKDGGARRDSQLLLVHRLDRNTSGLMLFARSELAQRNLKTMLRKHAIERIYHAMVHGELLAPITFRSQLLADRGDGLRGSWERATEKARRQSPEGRLAVTHVRPLAPLRGATLVQCQLETGRTHQIRIHLAEAAHPLLGETLYLRDFTGTPLDAPRLCLHSATLALHHPVSGAALHFELPLPEDMETVRRRLA